jgi:hypothetical protein
MHICEGHVFESEGDMETVIEERKIKMRIQRNKRKTIGSGGSSSISSSSSSSYRRIIPVD